MTRPSLENALSRTKLWEANWSPDQLDEEDGRSNAIVLAKEVERLQSIVDQLPRLADGTIATPGSVGYHPDGPWGIIPGVGRNGTVRLNEGRIARVSELYPTRKDAQAAREEA